MTPHKPTRGGARPGAGRKPAHGVAGSTLPYRVPPSVKRHLVAHARAAGVTPGTALVAAILALPADGWDIFEKPR